MDEQDEQNLALSTGARPRRGLYTGAVRNGNEGDDIWRALKATQGRASPGITVQHRSLQ